MYQIGKKKKKKTKKKRNFIKISDFLPYMEKLIRFSFFFSRLFSLITSIFAFAIFRNSVKKHIRIIGALIIKCGRYTRSFANSFLSSVFDIYTTNTTIMPYKLRRGGENFWLLKKESIRNNLILHLLHNSILCKRKILIASWYNTTTKKPFIVITVKESNRSLA